MDQPDEVEESPILNTGRFFSLYKNIMRYPAAFFVALLVAFLLAGCGENPTGPASSVNSSSSQPTPPDVPERNKNAPPYAGWAIDAYPDMTYEQMLADLKRMKDAGANVVWISHANPARPFAQEREVGLNPSVFVAYNDPTQYSHQDALAIAEANKRMLKACHELGLKAVLSVGYQTQMGQIWSAQHPQDLRRQANGKLWQVTNGNDPYGSVYSPTFQKDLYDYYRWVQFEFVDPFWDTVFMLNLADEPLGGDYSGWANQEFQKRTGYGFSEVGNSTERQEALGRFQANVITDFMTLAAGYWKVITPEISVTMSFDGGAMREENGLPNLESLFANAPANFVLTWDMYPRDRGSLDKPVNEADIARLFMLTRRIGGYSAVYNRPVWFWSAANSWGLGQTAANPGTIADAQANLLSLALLMNQTGGHLAGMAVWNYNIRAQGLYNYSCCGLTQKATWNEDEMFARVSQQFEAVRTIMAQPSNRPDVLFLRPPEWQYRQIGATKADYFLQLVDWNEMDALARYNVAGVEAGHWPAARPAQWSALKTVVTLAPPEYYTAQDLAGLRGFAESGGTVVISLGVARMLLGEDVSAWSDAPTEQPFGKGRFFISQSPVYQLFNTGSAEKLGGFWQSLFGRTLGGPGFTVQTAAGYLQYQIGQLTGSSSWPKDFSGQTLSRFTSNGQSQPFTSTNWSAQPLHRSEFIFGMAGK